MTNICAAIGVAQMERIDAILARKQQIAALYKSQLHGSAVEFQQPLQDVVSSNWLVSILLPRTCDREVVMKQLSGQGIDTRPVFYCAHHMPMYGTTDTFPVAEDIAARGISLPSYPGLSDEDVIRVAQVLAAAI